MKVSVDLRGAVGYLDVDSNAKTPGFCKTMRTDFLPACDHDILKPLAGRLGELARRPEEDEKRERRFRRNRHQRKKP
ncbi:MAG: hypothetical protein ACOX9C_08815 [Kiritimatiellia bacterium]